MLDKVSSYCSTWRCDVNTKKTEVAVFEADPSHPQQQQQQQWTIHGQPLKVVDKYKYLGLELYLSLRWDGMHERLYAKARAKFAKAFGMANSTRLLNVEFGVQLWKALIRPVLEYGCELWADEVWEQGEQLQRMVAKRILRCEDSTTNEAVLGELGWWTLKARSDMLRLRFWGKIVNKMGLDSVTKRVYLQSRFVFEHELRPLLIHPVFTGTEAQQRRQQQQHRRQLKHARSTNWCFGVYEMLQKYNLIDHWDSAHVGSQWSSLVFKAIRMREQQDWLVRMNEKDKLRTYRTLKSTLRCESYLAASDGEKSAYDVFKLRSGTNVLRIETGRYERVSGPTGKKEKKPIERRLCLMCMSGDVESEAHFLLHCHVFNGERQHCIDQLWQATEDGDLTVSWDMMTDQQRVQLILMGDCFNDAHERVWPIVRSFVGKIYRKRQRLNVK